MDHNEEFFEYLEIPKDFHSLETGQLISHCIDCERYLLDDIEYVLEKAIKNYPEANSQDVIFEYAICMDCADKMRKELSQESIASINNYFFSKIDINNLSESLETKTIDEMYSNCIITSKHQNELEEYQIYAHCKGSKMIKSIFPYMISIDAAMELGELLSLETRDFLDNFKDKHFAPPPEFEDILNGPKFVFI